MTVDDFGLHRRLLAAIAAAPADAGARLVYADFLEERGDPRAAFFRRPLGGSASERGGAWDACAREPFVRRFRFRSWVAETIGVVTQVTVPASVFVADGDALLDAFPLVDHVRFHLESRDEPARLAATPALARVPELSFQAENKQARLGNAGLEAFVASPHLGALAALGFDRSDVGPKGIAALGKARPPVLRRLAFAQNPVGAKGIAALARTSLALDELAFYHAALDDEAIALLVGWPGFATVRKLIVDYSEAVGDAALAALAGSRHAAALEELQLWGARVGDDGARALLESPHLGKLAKLHLNASAIAPSLREVLVARRGLVQPR